MIGRYKVSTHLQDLWNSLFEAHVLAKQNGFSKGLKNKTLDITEWEQYLADRYLLFCTLETRISNSSYPIQTSSLLHNYTKRSSLIELAIPNHKTILEPSIKAKQIANIITNASDWELELHVFIHYGELWFGGSVHAVWIKRLMKHNIIWQEYYFPGYPKDKLFKKPKNLSQKIHQDSFEYETISKITEWFRFGCFEEQKQLIQKYFDGFEHFLEHDDNSLKTNEIYKICNESMKDLTNLTN